MFIVIQREFNKNNNIKGENNYEKEYVFKWKRSRK